MTRPKGMPFWCWWGFHKWRYYWWITQDVCVREGCGEVRAHKDGTKAA